jgi:antitoxin component of RelBE/YafQ-DinJ toxin-antitoxin module
MKEIFESYSDYPEAVRNNAKRGIELNAKVNNNCATQIGKVRAQQLANGENISIETIKRMYSYLSRAETYYNPDDTEACGTISYLLWGGLAAKRWSESKLKELNLFNNMKEKLLMIFDKVEMRRISFDFDGTLSRASVRNIAKNMINHGDIIYIISARLSKQNMLDVAKQLGIPASRVFATGSNVNKIAKVKSLRIDTHYDNNANVIKALTDINLKGRLVK